MKRIALLLTLVLVVAACGDDDAAPTTTTVAETTTTEAATTTVAPTTTAPEATTTTTAAAPSGADLRITAVSFNDPMVVISNFGSAPGSVSGFWICQRPAYQPLPDVEIGAGESLAISLGGSVFLPPPGAITIDDQLSIGAVVVEGGEIALYRSNNFGNSDQIVSYVEWGVAGHGRSSFAIEAGIWGSGEFVATSDGTVGISIVDFNGSGASAWGATAG